MSIEIVAWSPKDGLALIRREGRLEEVRPPYSAEPKPVCEQTEAVAFRHWGYEAPRNADRYFDSLDALYQRLRVDLAETIERFKRLAEDRTPLSQTPVAAFDEARLMEWLDDLKALTIDVGDYDEAKLYLEEFMRLDNVQKHLNVRVAARGYQDFIKKNMSSARKNLFPIQCSPLGSCARAVGL